MIKKFGLIVILSIVTISFSSCLDIIGGGDSIPPQVSLYSPKSNDTIVLAPQEIIYDAFDDQGIAKVELYIDGVMQGSYPAENGVRPKVTLNLDSATFINKKFSYYIRVYDLGGNFTNSDTKTNITVILSKDPPSAPFGLSIIEPEGSSEIILSWQDSSKLVDGYEIWVSEINTNDASFYQYADVSGATRLFPFPKPGTINYYKIKGYNRIGKSPFSTIINSEGGTGSGVLGPTGLTAKAWGTKEVELNWTNRATDAVFLNVMRRAASSSLWSSIATVAANRTSYTDNSGSLSAGATYYYKIRVIAQSDSGFSKEVSVVTWPFDLNPASNLVAVYAEPPAASKKMVKLTWRDNSNQEESNIVERKEGAGGTYQALAYLSQDITAFDDTLVVPGKTYYYRIKIARQDYISKPSNEVFVTIPAGSKPIFRDERTKR
ncbi:MAG: hypothetical protein LC102_13325 [Ignavibacteriales bacterium]|mgnify:CR=1 FL=1|nr:MAG: hypothetical protein F9K26_00795 [Ignavibacteriaceae bacterium]MBW7871947.1 hypothetical protein [Ignavibacteria bacterium]MCZ2144395.1 hypothetical protein [Ignavibacteriales bacterium]OQY74915.1 MAG: hypothetical protein B6D45_06165 [Ignavibacteriales bacterium UTCHB3]MBV6446156.1 hypothetical protein [Ignavibacteriaceae bacterium]